MAYLEEYIVHCADTPKTMKVTAACLDEWHMAPRKLSDGKIRYLGKTYPSLEETPLKPQHIGKWGRGWDRYGYKTLIHRDGTKTTLVQVDSDQYITSDEMTWGAAGINSKSVHVCLAGGKLDHNKKYTTLQDFYDLFTEEQFYALRDDITEFISKHPQVKVSGHNMYSTKLCPGFDVSVMMDLMGLKEYSRF